MEKIKDKTKIKILAKFLVSLFIIILYMSCSTYKYQISPKNDESHRMIRLKVNYKDNKNKNSAKVIVLLDSNNRKLFVLNPLGRVHFKLILAGESTTAVYIKKKRYWKGIFKNFIEKFWGIDLTFEELINVVLSGKVPDSVKQNKSIKITIIQNSDKSTKIIEIIRGRVSLKLKILKNKIIKGKVDFSIKKEKLEEVTLERMFEK